MFLKPKYQDLDSCYRTDALRLRAILHDEAVYPDPFKFNPERFLKDGQLDPSVPDPAAAFGFGRRVWYVALSLARKIGSFTCSDSVLDNTWHVHRSG